MSHPFYIYSNIFRSIFEYIAHKYRKDFFFLRQWWGRRHDLRPSLLEKARKRGCYMRITPRNSQAAQGRPGQPCRHMSRLKIPDQYCQWVLGALHKVAVLQSIPESVCLLCRPSSFSWQWPQRRELGLRPSSLQVVFTCGSFAPTLAHRHM